jgi:hypothetical protein
MEGKRKWRGKWRGRMMGMGASSHHGVVIVKQLRRTSYPSSALPSMRCLTRLRASSCKLSGKKGMNPSTRSWWIRKSSITCSRVVKPVSCLLRYCCSTFKNCLIVVCSSFTEVSCASPSKRRLTSLIKSMADGWTTVTVGAPSDGDKEAEAIEAGEEVEEGGH